MSVVATNLLTRLAERLGLQGHQRLVAFDVETTGTDTQTDRIVQFAGYIIQSSPTGYGVRSIGPWLVNPRMPIPVEATAVHGISDDMVANSPTFAELAAEICGVLTPATGVALVAYNGRFDVRVTAAELARVGAALVADAMTTLPLIDPFRIFQRKHPRDLAAAVQVYLQRDHVAAHDASADILATLEVLYAQLDAHPDLPLDLDRLDVFCADRNPDWIDRDGKFTWKNGEAVVTFGKHNGVPMRRVDPSFFTWMLRQDFAADTKRIAERAAAGHFPERAQEAA